MLPHFQIGELPAYPVRVACEALADPHLEGKALLSAMAAASGVFYNYTRELKCFDFKVGANKETDEDGEFWGYQVCSSLLLFHVVRILICMVVRVKLCDQIWSQLWRAAELHGAMDADVA